MTDTGKFRILLSITTALTILALAYNVFQEHFMSDIEGYMKRRLYYDRVISKKDLSLHEGMYWREKE